MENLHCCFEKALKPLGLTGKLPCSLLEAAPSCLRFQIGGSGSPYIGDHRKPSGDYIDEALGRALEIYGHLPAAPEYLRIDRLKEDAGVLDSACLTRMGLPVPNFIDSQGPVDHLYWILPLHPPYLRSLLREIIRGELDPEGLDLLCSHVYFLSAQEGLIFTLYDDRWADVAALDKASLSALRITCMDWILAEH